VFGQERAHHLSLYTDATAVDNPYLLKAPANCLIQVFFDYDGDFVRLKRVEVDGVFDRDFVHSARI
jgi:hypothetical protein